MFKRLSPPGEPSLVGSYAPFEHLERFIRDDVLRTSTDGGRRRCDLSFRGGSDFFGHHSRYLGLPSATTRRKPQHTKSDDALRLGAELNSLEAESEPRIKHVRHPAGTEDK